MASRTKDAAKRTLVVLAVISAALVALLAGGVTKSDAEWTPRLGLDLEGGTQIILKPKLAEGQQVTTEQLDQARNIIVQRVDGQGTTGAEVTTQGDANIVVSVPGKLTPEQRDAITAASQMQFRPVLATAPGVTEPTPTSTSGPSGATPSGSTSSASPSSSKAAPSASDAGSASPTSASPTSASRDRARTAPAATSTSSSSSKSATSSSSTATSSAKTTSPKAASPTTPAAAAQWTPTGKPTGAADPNTISTALYKEFVALDCSADAQTRSDDADAAIIACSDKGDTKYILGPMAVAGSQIKDAAGGYGTGQQGQVTNQVEIQLSFQSEGTKEYAAISRTLVAAQRLSQTSPVNPPATYNALATVLDGRVLVAPGFNEAIPSGNASITGDFTIEEARALAQSLKFGALPISFSLDSDQEISATLGSEQLRWGVIAGVIGLLLVFVYSIIQYRLLAMVTVGSMLVAFGLTYLVIALLSWGYNYRLDMAGVTGLIIAIGVTADSFIVYFERVRDELREGRNLRAAVEAGWARAKRTILVADGVNFLAAIILYLLASSSVRGFAFTLGLTTLIDLAIFWLFTHPVLTLLARNRFFASGHPWSGFDVDNLRAAGVRYQGRGRSVVQPEIEPDKPARPGVTSDEGAVL